MRAKIHLETINSTNIYAKDNIDKFDDRTIIYADRQTDGRGRFTRSWVDLGPENLFMTIILKPSGSFSPEYSNLTQYLSLKLCRVLEQFGVSPKIKWPNDVLVNNKKISGILSEAVFGGGNLKGIVLGIGVNLNAKEEDINAIPDRIATSLNIESGLQVNRNEFMENVLEEFDKDYDKFLTAGFEFIRHEYTRRIVLLGERITVQHLNEKIDGIFSDVNSDGTIKLLTGTGERNLSIGDIL